MGSRILVVEDNPINLKLICEVLECEGYDVRRAADAVEALAALNDAPPDLILMDLALPGMDGLALTRLLKSKQETSSIPIIAVTALAMKGDDARAFEAGCDGYLPKPVDTRRLRRQVAEVLEWRRQRRAAEQ